jgi:zinc transporter ZupT
LDAEKIHAVIRLVISGKVGIKPKLQPAIMHLLPNLLLAIVTMAGGCLPLVTRSLDDKRMHLLLAFSGSFLLGITCLHLLPETFTDLPQRAGVYLLIGFFLQLLIQRATHGVEHGHAHIHGAGRHIPVVPIILGLSLHAFMEGLPLGFNYRNDATNPSLYLAVGAHKLPEAMLLGVLLRQAFSLNKALAIICAFALITPGSAVLATALGMHYGAMSRTVTAVIPVVAGAFIHISTTIFFESGTRQHLMTVEKIGAILLGVTLAGLTLALE